MKTKKIFAIIMVELSMLCAFCIFQMSQKAHAKTITIEKGDTYYIKVKKGSKISISNKKIAKINKKGRITALKKGKCIIKVKKGSKTKKYKVCVKNAKKENTAPVISPAPSPSQDPTPPPQYKDLILGGLLYDDGLTVERIEKKDDTASYIYLTCSSSKRPAFLSQKDYESGVKYIRVDKSNQYISEENIIEGSKVYIIYNLFNMTYENVGDTCIVDGFYVNIYLK